MDQPKRDLKETVNGSTGGVNKASAAVADSREFVKDAIQELKRVQWPTRRQVAVETGVVFFTVAFMSVTVSVFDWLLGLATSPLFSP